MLIVKATKDSEAGVLPGKELFEAMGRFNQEMADAGVLLAGEGLQPTSQGARVRFSGGKATAVDGPFTETKDLIAGFWIIQVNSKEEAVQWALRSPAPHGAHQDGEIEVRRIFETEDFPPEVFSPEEAAKEDKLREELRKRAAQ